MTLNHHLKSTLAVLAAGTLLISGGCSDGTSLDAPPGNVQTFSDSGRLLQAPVKGAKVCADLNKNQLCDPAEPFATSDATGNFTLSFEGASTLDYDIVSEGGLTTNGAGVDIAARNMAALRGSAVVSMLTTMEVATPAGAQREALVAQLNTLAGGADFRTLDFSANAVPRELMLMVKTVESVLDGFGSLGAGSGTQQQVVLEQLAAAIAAAPALSAATIDASLPALVGTAAQGAIGLLADPNLQITSAQAFGDAMAAVVSSVAAAIPAGATVTEGAIQAAVETAAQTATDNLATVVTSLVKVDLASVTLTTNAGPQSWSAATLPTGLTLSSLPSTLAVTGSATNTTGVAKSFSNVTLTLSVAQPTRSILLSIGGLSANVAANGTLTLSKGTAPLQVQGLTTSGAQVLFSMADTSWGTVSGATVTFDLNALNAQLLANGGRDLNTLVAAGSYTISATVTGAPFVTMNNTLALTLQ
jgi:ethanolamine utilization microcompartment shell protein EutS